MLWAFDANRPHSGSPAKPGTKKHAKEKEENHCGGESSGRQLGTRRCAVNRSFLERGGSGKAGTVSILGVYGEVDSFPIGNAMEKNLTLTMGNCNHRRYIPRLIELVRSGSLNPAEILTQREPLISVIEAYKSFDKRKPGWIKVKLEPANESSIAA